MEVDKLVFKEHGSLICCYDTNMPKLSSKSSKDPFPVDIIYKILSRLPIKSLARFRCVSKLWLEYINDPYLRIIYVKEPTPILFQHFPRCAPDKIEISFLLGVRKEPVLELCYEGMFFGYLIVGSCNGLLLVCYEQDPFDDGTFGFAVINPLSKERRDLPPIPNKMTEVDLGGPHLATGIAFDHSTSTLKTVFFIVIDPYTNVVYTMVHSLGSSSWRETTQNPPYPLKDEGVYGHGRLHWLVNWVLIQDERKIVWFDVNTEEFGSMDPPIPKEGGYLYNEIQLADLNGEVGFSYFGPFCIKLWILKQQEEWVLHCCFDLGPILLPPYDTREYDIQITGCWNNDGDLLLNYNRGERLFVYTLKSGVLREVDPGDSCEGSDIRVYQSGMFSLHTSA